MSEDGLHVVFGVGQVGRALSARLAGLGLVVRAVSRHRPARLADGVDWRTADASDPQAANDAAEGADVIEPVERLGSRASALRQQMVDERLRHRAYTRELGDDSRDVRDWTCPERPPGVVA